MSTTPSSHAGVRHTTTRGDIHLAVIALISIGMIGYAAATNDRLLAIIGAALFAQRMIFTGWFATRAWHVPGTANDDMLPPLKVLQTTTRLTSITLVWAGIALLISYPIVGLKWQHGWQYGAGALLLAAGFAAYAKRLWTAGDPATLPGAIEFSRKLSIGFAAAIAGSAIWLIASGKLATIKNDWLANDVFLATGACIFALAVLCVVRARDC